MSGGNSESPGNDLDWKKLWGVIGLVETMGFESTTS